MTLLTILRRTELVDDFESVLQRCGIDSPQRRRALNGLLEQHPSVASVRVYKTGGPCHIDISTNMAAVILSVSGRGTNRRLKVNGVQAAASD
jgi:hypothetical protein